MAYKSEQNGPSGPRVHPYQISKVSFLRLGSLDLTATSRKSFFLQPSSCRETCNSSGPKMDPRAVDIADFGGGGIISRLGKGQIYSFNTKDPRHRSCVISGRIGLYSALSIPSSANCARDSYRSWNAHKMEERGPVSRGFERYDPYTRRYVEWAVPEDWQGRGTHGNGIGENGDGLPRFTRDEAMRMGKELDRGRLIDPSKMGDDWTWLGPKVGVPALHRSQILICM